MRQTKCLFVLAGFSGDVDRPIASLRSQLGAQNYDFIGRTYPTRPDKRATYVREVGRSIIAYIFGDGEATGFCRAVDQPCAMHGGERRGRTCRHERGDRVACFRERPKMLVIICHARIYQEILDRFGRAALLLVHATETLDDIGEVAARIDLEMPALNAVYRFLENLKQDMLAPRLPMHNFQRAANLPIAADAQRDLAHFSEIMQSYHARLHDPGFRNARRRYMRGAYRLDDSVGFQRDRLHDSAHVGQESRADVFHLINAYHLYGAAVLPDMHFDVVAERDTQLRVAFRDIVTGEQTSPADRHVNVSPCDRLV